MILFTNKGLFINKEVILTDPALAEKWAWENMKKVHMIYECQIKFDPKAPKKFKYVFDHFKETDEYEKLANYNTIICENTFVPLEVQEE